MATNQLAGLLDDPLDQNNQSAVQYDATGSQITQPVSNPPDGSNTTTTGIDSSTDYTAPEFDSSGLLSDSVNDINTLTSMNNPLMKKAETVGKQFANDHGLLNSSMAAGAVESSRLDTVMPLVQQNAQTRGQAALQGREFDFNAGENALNRQHDITMQNLDTESRSQLINLEQQWNQVIQSDVNAAAFWQSSIDGLMDIFNNPDMTPEQQQAARDELLGRYDENGNWTDGIIGAGLGFLSNLTTMNVGSTGAQSTNTGTGATQPVAGAQNTTGLIGDDNNQTPLFSNTVSSSTPYTPKEIFGNAYMYSSPNGTSVVDKAQLSDDQRTKIRMAELIRDGIIKWDTEKKDYVPGDQYNSQDGNLNKGMYRYPFGEGSKTAENVDERQNAVNADKEAERNRLSTGLGPVETDLIRIMAEIEKNNKLIKFNL